MLLGDSEVAAGNVGVEIDARMFEHCAGSPPHATSGRRSRIADRLASKEKILGDCEVGKSVSSWNTVETPALRASRGLPKAHLAAREMISPAVGSINAGEQLHQSRFAGAVLARDRMDGPGKSARKGHRGKRLGRAETLGDVAELDRVAAGGLGTRDGRRGASSRLPSQPCV